LAKVFDAILESFYLKLSESDAIEPRTIAELRVLFAGKKLKADDVVAAISGDRHERSQ
jgi:hypothetical protein